MRICVKNSFLMFYVLILQTFLSAGRINLPLLLQFLNLHPDASDEYQART